MCVTCFNCNKQVKLDNLDVCVKCKYSSLSSVFLLPKCLVEFLTGILYGTFMGRVSSTFLGTD